MLAIRLEDLDRNFRPFGKHLVCLDGDILWFVFRGLIDLSEMVNLVSISYALTERFGYALILCDTTAAKGATAEARRYQNESHRQRWYPNHSALYGVSVVIRAMMVLSLRATELMTGKQNPMTFHRDESEAREFLGIQRTAMATKPRSQDP